MIPESGKLFKENCQSRSLDICAASAGYIKSHVTPHVKFEARKVNIVVCYYSWIGSFDVRSLNSCKCVARWILCHYWLLREIVWLFRG